jgi:hypothetical protein
VAEWDFHRRLKSLVFFQFLEHLCACSSSSAYFGDIIAVKGAGANHLWDLDRQLISEPVQCLPRPLSKSSNVSANLASLGDMPNHSQPVLPQYTLTVGKLFDYALVLMKERNYSKHSVICDNLCGL